MVIKDIAKKQNFLVNYKNMEMYHKDQDQEVLLIHFNFLSKIKLLKMIEMKCHQNHQNITKTILNKFKISMKKQI